MKKFIFAMLISVAMVGCSTQQTSDSTSANTNLKQVSISTTPHATGTFSFIYYDEQAQIIYGVTEADKDGRRWVLGIDEKDHSQEKLIQLNDKLKGAPVHISYDTNGSEDPGDWDVVNWSTTDSEVI